MRQKRSKAYRKQMLVYNHTFKFRAPYQVIVDHEIVEVAQYLKLDLEKYIRNTVQDEIKPMITQCSMQKLYESKNQQAIELAKRFERRRCGHKDHAIDPSDCINSIIDIKGQNKHRYVVVTQDLDLRRKLRQIPGVPLIYMNRSVMVMEPLSRASEQKQKEYEESKLSGGLNDKNAGLREVQEQPEETAAKKRKKGPKEPNPLSVKKKKVEKAPLSTDEGGREKKKRKRRHKKRSENNEEGGAEEDGHDDREVSESGSEIHGKNEENLQSLEGLENLENQEKQEKQENEAETNGSDEKI